MKEIVLENLVHRGTVSAEGFLFSAKSLLENEIRRRILSRWTNSAKLYRYKEFYVLLFAETFQVDCRKTIGLPLVRYSKILSTFPLRDKQLKLFPGDVESLVFLAEGKIEKIPARNLEPDDISDWFDISDFQIIETETLGEIIIKPVLVQETKELNLRENLNDIPKADEQLSEILMTLKKKKAEFEMRKENNFSSGGFPISSSGFSGSPSVSKLFGDLLFSLKGLFGSDNSSGHSSVNSQNAERKDPGGLKKFLTKMAFKMKLAQLVGRKQAEYLAKMMEMFESGNLDEALKYAIPLENLQEIREMTESMPFLGFLKPRHNLNLNFGSAAGSGSSVHLEQAWFDNLRQLYRQSFERLEAQNRIDEAAFILAELLQNYHEAVEFLERHGKYKVAARLAESRNLGKEIIIRLWYLAGDKHKAVQLAVLHNSFEYIVTKLEQQNHPDAPELREIWARTLAESGNYQAAVNTIWQLKDWREIAKNWIEQTISFGGLASARMLVKKISLMPESFSEVRECLQRILDSDETEEREKRRAFAQESLQSPVNQELSVLLRPLIRRLLVDLTEENSEFTVKNLRQLVESSKDYSLRTDLPKLPEHVQEENLKTAEIKAAATVIKISANDKGVSKIYDACLLPDGKVALALGESGVKILSKHGKMIAHFDQPTQKFIVSHSGTKAIGLAMRDEVVRLSKIDFVNRTAKYWCDARISTFAPTFDGNIWFIAQDDEVYAIDANAEKFESVWRVSEVGGDIYEITATSAKLMLLILTSKGFEKWWYDLPGLTLRSRNETQFLVMENENQQFHSAASHIAHAIVQISEIAENQEKMMTKIFDYDAKIADFETKDFERIFPPQIYGNIFAFGYSAQKDCSVTLYRTPKKQIITFAFEGNNFCNFKLDENNLTITDSFGRVIIYDYSMNITRKNIRI